MKFEITMPYKLIKCMIKIGICFREKCNKIGLFSFKSTTGHFIETPWMLTSKTQYISANKIASSKLN